MKTDRPCILVYNPISGHGHLDTWNAIFIALMLQQGWSVLALTPDAAALMSRLSVKGDAESRLKVLPWIADVKTPWPLMWKKRLLRAWWQRGRAGQSASPALESERYFFVPAEFAMRVNAALKRTSWQPALVFNMYMDMFKTDARSWNEFSALDPWPWAGIRFVPPDVPVESYYELPSFKGMCLLDERLCRNYQAKMPDKCFEYLPDITDTALPDKPSALAQEIERRAAGRKIVFFGGSIGGQKNVAQWYELVQRADPRQWFFVQIGELHEVTFTPEDVAAFKKVTAQPPENLFMYAEYLADDRAFNEIIHMSDVVFAVYRAFKISSNMVTKAASFKKPILVSDGYLMGDRVKRYGIGLAVAEDDTGAILAGLTRLGAAPIPPENFSQFHRDFSQDSVAKRLDEFLRRCLHGNAERRL